MLICLCTVIGSITGGIVGAPSSIIFGAVVGGAIGLIVGLSIRLGIGDLFEDTYDALPDHDHDGIPDIFDD